MLESATEEVFVIRPISETCAAIGLILTAIALLTGSHVRAADDQGQFAIRGAGLINCALFSQARKNQEKAYLVTAAWVDGYITGVNQHATDAYDISPFESTELLMAIVDEHCQNHPKDPVFGVLLNLFKQLWPDRLLQKSEKVTITTPGRETQHYVEIIERIQRKLQAGGYYKGPISGKFSSETVEALKGFQRSVDFNPTGFPDQATLWRLLRSQ